MSTLENLIAGAVGKAGGVISLADFMELALYAPGLGYYERRERAPGRQGDYYTSVSVGNLFGRLLAARFAGWLASLPPTTPPRLVEAGAHDGRLAADLLAAWPETGPECPRTVEYWIVEPSPRRQQWQRDRLAGFADKVRWAGSLDDLPGDLAGVIFSNELLDAFPAHRLVWEARRRDWDEWGVGREKGAFVWRRLGPAGDLRRLLPELPGELLEILPDGFAVDVCPAALAWWRQAASRLRQGWLLTFDYGLEELEFLAPARSAGTLRAYHRHQLQKNPLARPGLQDLTSHVNFTALRKAGEEAGLETVDFCSQEEFLVKLVRESGWPSAAGRENSRWTRQWQTLTHPAHLGARFQALAQRRRRSWGKNSSATM